MKEFTRYRYTAIIILIIVAVIVLFTKCVNQDTVETGIIKNFKGKKFAGSATCASCHKSIYDTHVKTAHFLTSGIASGDNIRGSFETGKNTVAYDRHNVVTMEKRDSSFYQVEYRSGIQKNIQRIDITVGSGTMGQSYLYWAGNQLFQLPVSYFGSANEWSNNPGFPNQVIFNRFITSRCLECHSTFAKTLSPPDVDPEKFDRTQLIYGVDCEKCHGPAEDHVAFQTENPTAKTARYITNPARLSRQQNMDLCSSCHGGRLYKNKPSFSFTAGDTLSHFFNLDTGLPDPTNIDVHGNQNGLLRASKCFRMSETLNCNTCHNTHVSEKGNTALFSQRCMSCHNPDHGPICKMSATLGAAIKNNCIDCHMPLKPSRKIAVFLPGATAATAAMIRSHLISIYPDETNKMLAFIKKPGLKPSK
ncbi:MAG: multiheme c-type cytochrome [Ferruginibacter sp.]